MIMRACDMSYIGVYVVDVFVLKDVSWNIPTHLSPLRFSSCSSVAICRAPVQPSGCPNAMAPPLGLTFSIGMPR